MSDVLSRSARSVLDLLRLIGGVMLTLFSGDCPERRFRFDRAGLPLLVRRALVEWWCGSALC
jgi:hypothetical protein